MFNKIRKLFKIEFYTYLKKSHLRVPTYELNYIRSKHNYIRSFHKK